MTRENSAIPDRRMLQSLRACGLLDDSADARFEMLTGGVSSDIWKVETADSVFCVKRALEKLKVEADWFAPLERNRYEVRWYRIANELSPGSAPRILAHDDDAMLFAMEYLDPARYRLWKSELRDGRADADEAARVGRRLGRIHAGSAGDADIAAAFPCDDIFRAIRLEPYLEATAARHPKLESRLFRLSERTADTRLAMIHGDVSPKNILLGPDGPVFLDAECACIGDPAFDLAFCLNHFLLKCLWTPAATAGFFDCFAAMTAAYLDEVGWESPDELEQRAASLLPGLLLARVDGKSPVEYIENEDDRERVRRCARTLLIDAPSRLHEVADAWREELN